MVHAVNLLNYPIYAILGYNSRAALNSIHAVPSFLAWSTSKLFHRKMQGKEEWIPVESALGLIPAPSPNTSPPIA